MSNEKHSPIDNIGETDRQYEEGLPDKPVKDENFTMDQELSFIADISKTPDFILGFKTAWVIKESTNSSAIDKPEHKDEGKKFKERINYVISNGQYCGHSVNFPIVVQAESLEKLKEQMRVMVKVFVKDIQQTLDEDAFEFVEEQFSSPPYPASKSEGIDELAEKLYPTKTDLSDPNRELHGSMNREYKRCFIEGFKAASKDELLNDPFIKKHLAIIKEKTLEYHIQDKLKHLQRPPFDASIKYFLETGTVNGSFMLAIKSLFDNLPKLISDTASKEQEGEEDTVGDAIRSMVDAMAKISYWKRRCEAAEKVIESMNQPDYSVHLDYKHIWQELKNQNL